MVKRDLIKILSIVPIENLIFRKDDKALDRLEERIKSRRQSPSLPQPTPAVATGESAQRQAQPTVHESGSSEENVATACVPCTLGHFSTTSGLLKEALRFKDKGVQSEEVADRIGQSLEELNALERIDLSADKLRSAPEWERPMAEEALQNSRALRHKLENISSMNELENAANEANDYYRNLNRNWFKQRIQNMSDTEKAKVTEKAMQKLSEESSE